MKINWTGNKNIKVSGSSGGTLTINGGAAGPVGGNITITGGVNKSASGNQNIVIGNQGANYGGSYIPHPTNPFTVFRDNSDEWMRWKHESEKAEIKISDGWVVLEPAGFKGMHHLDLGAAVDTKGKEDLTEIREQYEEHIKNSPWLERLRNDYDDLVEKHKLFDAIRGDDDAEI